MKLRTDVWDQTDQDITRVFEEMRKSGYLELLPNGMYRCITAQYDMDSPYLFFGEHKAHDACHLYFDILFVRFGLVPSYCQASCWKIVVKNRTFIEFWNNYEKVSTLGLFGKGGADPRDYTGGMWPIFVYNHSKEEGLENWKKIVEVLGEDMKDLVILKRGCTEMEMQQPVRGWRVSPSQKKKEAEIMRRLDYSAPIKINQPDWLVNYKIRNWVRAAHRVGDMTYKELWGDAPLYVEPVRFEHEVNG